MFKNKSKQLKIALQNYENYTQRLKNKSKITYRPNNYNREDFNRNRSKVI